MVIANIRLKEYSDMRYQYCEKGVKKSLDSLGNPLIFFRNINQKRILPIDRIVTNQIFSGF